MAEHDDCGDPLCQGVTLPPLPPLPMWEVTVRQVRPAQTAPTYFTTRARTEASALDQARLIALSTTHEGGIR